MSHRLTFLGLMLLGPLSAGCAFVTEENATDEPVAAVAQPQIDPGQRYFLAQGGVTKAASWRGAIGSSPDVEYWVSKPAYTPGAARTFSSAASGCAGFKRQVCSSEWAGSTYYRAHVDPSTYSCSLPPGPCSPTAGAVSFLGNGTYSTLNAAGSPYATTYVSGACEYWAMQNTVTNASVQSPVSSGAYSSLSQFETAMCAQSPQPPTWFSVYYEPVEDFCSSPSTC